jgi:hypothetical protein
MNIKGVVSEMNVNRDLIDVYSFGSINPTFIAGQVKATLTIQLTEFESDLAERLFNHNQEIEIVVPDGPIEPLDRKSKWRMIRVEDV